MDIIVAFRVLFIMMVVAGVLFLVIRVGVGGAMGTVWR